MWQRFTEKARKVVFYAQEEAQKYKMGYVGPEHLLLGLLREPDNVGCQVILSLGQTLPQVRAEIEKCLAESDHPSQDMTLTPSAKRVIDFSNDEMRNLNDNFIGTEHLLLGLIREEDSVTGRLFARLGITLDAARREVIMSPTKSVPRLSDLEDRTPPQPKPGRPEDFFGFLMGNCLPQHLMLNLIADEAGLSGRIIRDQCENIGALQWELWNQILRIGKEGLRSPDPSQLNNILGIATQEAGASQVESQHILLALLQGEPSAFLSSMLAAGVTLARSRELIAQGN